jgi:hypothetical protein
MPAPDTIAGQDVDILTHLFLNAPLPNLPQPHHLFQNEDVNKPRAGVSHQQLVDHYHIVAKAIETSFSANAILSPSAWVRTMSDIISCILQGVLTSRNLGPDGKPLDHDEFKGLLNEEDWEVVRHNLTNLNHLAQIFPPPLDCREPPLICTHCYHQTNPEASDQLTMVDYSSVLMALDCSRSAVIGHFMKILSREIKKDIQQWHLEETSKRKNTIRARIMEDVKAYYTQQWNKKTQVQDRIIKANCQEYYSK